MKKVAIVTGGSSGIGSCVAERLSKQGYQVYELSRTGKNREDLIHIDCDVTESEDIIKAINEIISRENRIDLVMNCAGFGISGAVEYTDIIEAKRQFEVNFFGTIEVNRTCIPHLKNSKDRIVNISSVAAL